MSTAVAQKIVLAEIGAPLKEVDTGLTKAQLRILSELGYTKVPVLYQAIKAAPLAFSKRMKLSDESVRVIRKKLKEADSASVRETGLPRAVSTYPHRGGVVRHAGSQTARAARGQSRLSGKQLKNELGFLKPNGDDACIQLLNKMPRIKNQGQRGTCVAFALCRCYETTLDWAHDLSEQFVYWIAKSVDRLDEEGSTLEHGLKAIEKFGACIESLSKYRRFPYEARQHVRTQAGPRPTEAAFSDGLQRKHNSHRELDPSDVAALKVCLFNNSPVAITIPIFSSWTQNGVTEQNGIVKLPFDENEETEEFHAITLTGYVEDHEQPGGGYFIFDNSWGEDWASENTLFGPGRGMLPFAYLTNYCTREDEAYIVT